MASPGAIVIVDFPGAMGIKRRPAIVISSAAYHAARPDIILAVITSQVASANAPTDYILQDWSSAGIKSSFCFSVLPGHTSSDKLGFRNRANIRS